MSNGWRFDKVVFIGSFHFTWWSERSPKLSSKTATDFNRMDFYVLVAALCCVCFVVDCCNAAKYESQNFATRIQYCIYNRCLFLNNIFHQLRLFGDRVYRWVKHLVTLKSQKTDFYAPPRRTQNRITSRRFGISDPQNKEGISRRLSRSVISGTGLALRIGFRRSCLEL